MVSLFINGRKVLKPIASMIDEWADYMQVNDECDEMCASKCFNLNKSNKQFFDEDCLNNCDCHFKQLSFEDL